MRPLILCLRILLPSALLIVLPGDGAWTGHNLIQPMLSVDEELALRRKDDLGADYQEGFLAAYRGCSSFSRNPGELPQASCARERGFVRRVRRLLPLVSDAPRTETAMEILRHGVSSDVARQQQGTVQELIERVHSGSGSSDTVTALTTLAATQLMRAQQRQSIRDLMISIECALRALDRQPAYGPALFTLALGSHWMGLRAEARAAWMEFLTTDTASRWADEAKSHLHALNASVRNVGGSDSLAPILDLYAETALDETWFEGLRVLQRWALSTLQGDSTGTRALLERAGAIADGLEVRGHDPVLADMVGVLREQAHDRKEVKRVACALSFYYSVMFRLRHDAGSEAQDYLPRLSFDTRVPEPLRHIASVSLVAAMGRQVPSDATIALVEQAAEQMNGVRYPALAGRVYGELASTLFRAEKIEEALSAAEKSVKLLHEADGANLYEARAQLLLARIRDKRGESEAVYTSIHQALTSSITIGDLRSDVLFSAAEFALGEGLTRVAVRLQTAGFPSASRSGGRDQARALLSRSRALAASGKSRSAFRDIRHAGYLLNAFSTQRDSALFESELRLIEAEVSLHDQPRRSVTLLDSIIQSGPDSLLRVAALTLRSEARLMLNDPDGAAANLLQTGGLTEASRPHDAARRTRLENLSRRIVMQYVHAGREWDALRWVQAARVVEAVRVRPDDDSAGAMGHAPMQTALVYLVVGDTLLIWTKRGEEVHLTRSTISRRQLVGTIAFVRLALELGRSDEELRPHLALLHEWLIQPVQRRIGEETPLVIVPDAEIGSVPFAALYDAGRQSYLIELHSLRLGQSLGGPLTHRRRLTSAEPAVVIVSDPAFDRQHHPRLQRLPHAVVEADSIALLYSRRSIVADEAASQPTVERLLEHADIFHFAGHATYDSSTPEQSHLILAARPRSPGDDLLSAEEIEELDLRHVRLVVLAGCETLRIENNWPGSFEGLAPAVLAAGAEGVVGSSWRVRDDLTSTLMISFHREYSRSGDAAEALRRAQLSLLRSHDQIRRSPAAWAGFLYMGR